MYWIMTAVLILLIDQVSKRFCLRHYSSDAPWVQSKGPRFRLVRNARMGFGFLRTPEQLVLLWVGVAISILILILFYPPLQQPYAQFGLGFAFGGATSNGLDIIKRGAVIDFIDLRMWPVFNLADVAIVGGATWVTLNVLGF